MKHPTNIERVDFRIRFQDVVCIGPRGTRVCATKSTYSYIICLNLLEETVVRPILKVSTTIHTIRNRRRYIIKISVGANRHRGMPVKDGDIYRLRLGKHSRTTFEIEVAVSPKAVVQGLSGRPSLKEGAGMLFIFPNISRQSMWMIEMKFPLDIVWLDENLTVVHITYNTPPCANEQNCPSYSSVRRVKYAIEMTAGSAEAYGFKKDLQLLVTS